MAAKRGKTLEERLLALREPPGEPDRDHAEPARAEPARAEPARAEPGPADPPSRQKWNPAPPVVLVDPVVAPPQLVVAAPEPIVAPPQLVVAPPQLVVTPPAPIVAPPEPAVTRPWATDADTLLPADAANAAPGSPRPRRLRFTRGSEHRPAASVPEAGPERATAEPPRASRWVLAELVPSEDVGEDAPLPEPLKGSGDDGPIDNGLTDDAPVTRASKESSPISTSIFNRWLKGPRVVLPDPEPVAVMESELAAESELVDAVDEQFEEVEAPVERVTPAVEAAQAADAPFEDRRTRPAVTITPAGAPEAPDAVSPWDRRRTGARRFGPIGAAMVERGLINNDQLEEALVVQRSTGRRVGDILVELGNLSAFELARVLADHLGVPFTDLRSKPPDPLLATFLPEEVARRYCALAIARWNDQLVIAMANPTDLFALDDLQLVTRQPIIAAMAVKADLLAALDRVYRVSEVETTLDAAASDHYAAPAESSLAAEVNDGPVVRLVNALLDQAIRDRASDLHVEPCSTHVAVRFRIDGVLHDSSEVPLSLMRPLVSRLKILADLDIAQNRLAQDGRFSVSVNGRPIDVRVVTVPTAAGEAVILRLLDPTRDALDVSSLGFTPHEAARFLPPFLASQGAAFITGPTGSGKTSTVYAVLSEINTRSKCIISVEDPVEFRLDGIKQIQVNPRIGLTFPTTLPSILRADPDVVFIGEVRDAATAQIAADASITGHLVLSTLHATRAAAAPMRLIEMGVEPYLVASSLTLVAAQRLARKLCDLCAVPVDSSVHEVLRRLGADAAVLEGATVRGAVGCAACRGTGFQGRLPLFEIMPVTEGISRLVLDRSSRADVERLAVEEGMDTLRTAALRRVVRGVLSVEEMMRVVS